MTYTEKVRKEVTMLNQITLHGYLGRDTELSEVNGQNGTFSKVTFTLAVSRDYGDETDWFYCVMYGKRANVLDKYFSKGSEIIIRGRMESYKPKTDESRTNWNVRVEDFNFVGKKSATETAPQGFTEVDYDEEDAPF